VKLTLNFLKKVGDVQDNQETYLGLLPGLPNLDVVVVDLERGLTMDTQTLKPDVPNDNGDVAYQAGTITFSPQVRWSLPPSGAPGLAESIAGKHVRIYYRTEDEFGLQVQKAYTNYLRSADPRTVTPGQYGQEEWGYLLFPPSDHRQTVLVDYSFTEMLPDRPPRRVRVSGELQPIRDPVEDLDAPQRFKATVPPNAWFIRLNNAYPHPGDAAGRPTVAPGSIMIHSVRGVSVRSRVVWREGPRWRRLENSTYLARRGT
jgi:hypothetical protein